MGRAGRVVDVDAKASTAAAADEHQRDDEDPDPVVIKYVAQAVIHGRPP